MSERTAPPETRTAAAEEMADRYMALWNEPDPGRRREMVAELWAADGRHLLQPPMEIRRAAAEPGIGLTAVLEARGHAEIAARVASAHEHWVRSEGLGFRRRGGAWRLGDVLAFGWEAVTAGGGVAAAGLDVLLLGPDGRIDRDHTFVEG